MAVPRRVVALDGPRTVRLRSTTGCQSFSFDDDVQAACWVRLDALAEPPANSSLLERSSESLLVLFGDRRLFSFSPEAGVLESALPFDADNLLALDVGALVCERPRAGRAARWFVVYHVLGRPVPIGCAPEADAALQSSSPALAISTGGSRGVFAADSGTGRLLFWQIGAVANTSSPRVENTARDQVIPSAADATPAPGKAGSALGVSPRPTPHSVRFDTTVAGGSDDIDLEVGGGRGALLRGRLSNVSAASRRGTPSSAGGSGGAAVQRAIASIADAEGDRLFHHFLARDAVSPTAGLARPGGAGLQQGELPEEDDDDVDMDVSVGAHSGAASSATAADNSSWGSPAMTTAGGGHRLSTTPAVPLHPRVGGGGLHHPTVSPISAALAAGHLPYPSLRPSLGRQRSGTNIESVAANSPSTSILMRDGNDALPPRPSLHAGQRRGRRAAFSPSGARAEGDTADGGGGPSSEAAVDAAGWRSTGQPAWFPELPGDILADVAHEEEEAMGWEEWAAAGAGASNLPPAGHEGSPTVYATLVWREPAAEATSTLVHEPGSALPPAPRAQVLICEGPAQNGAASVITVVVLRQGRARCFTFRLAPSTDGTRLAWVEDASASARVLRPVWEAARVASLHEWSDSPSDVHDRRVLLHGSSLLTASRSNASLLPADPGTACACFALVASEWPPTEGGASVSLSLFFRGEEVLRGGTSDSEHAFAALRSCLGLWSSALSGGGSIVHTGIAELLARAQLRCNAATVPALFRFRLAVSRLSQALRDVIAGRCDPQMARLRALLPSVGDAAGEAVQLAVQVEEAIDDDAKQQKQLFVLRRSAAFGAVTLTASICRHQIIDVNLDLLALAFLVQLGAGATPPRLDAAVVPPLIDLDDSAATAILPQTPSTPSRLSLEDADMIVDSPSARMNTSASSSDRPRLPSCSLAASMPDLYASVSALRSAAEDEGQGASASMNMGTMEVAACVYADYGLPVTPVLVTVTVAADLPRALLAPPASVIPMSDAATDASLARSHEPLFDLVRAITTRGFGHVNDGDPSQSALLAAANRSPPLCGKWPADIPAAVGYACIGRLDLAATHDGASCRVSDAAAPPGGLRSRALRAVLTPPPAGVGLGCLTVQGVSGCPLGEVGKAAMAATAIINASVGTPDLSAGAPPGDDTDGLRTLSTLGGGLRFARDRRLGFVAGMLRSSRTRRIYSGGASEHAQVRKRSYRGGCGAACTTAFFPCGVRTRASAGSRR